MQSNVYDYTSNIQTNRNQLLYQVQIAGQEQSIPAFHTHYIELLSVRDMPDEHRSGSTYLFCGQCYAGRERIAFCRLQLQQPEADYEEEQIPAD